MDGSSTKAECVLDLDSLVFMLNCSKSSARLGQTAREAFPNAQKDLLLSAYQALFGAINWSWLKWLESRDFEVISRSLTEVVDRGIELYSWGEYEGLYTSRPLHDAFLMTCAVLSGNRQTMLRASEAVPETKEDGVREKYASAWAGVLRCRCLGDEAGVMRQHEIFKRHRPSRLYPWPSPKLAKAFVEKDWKALAAAIRANTRKHWMHAEACGALQRSAQGPAVLNLKKKDLHYLWPYVEATAGKLAMMEGAEIRLDEVWFPLEMVRGRAE